MRDKKIIISLSIVIIILVVGFAGYYLEGSNEGVVAVAEIPLVSQDVQSLAPLTQEDFNYEEITQKYLDKVSGMSEIILNDPAATDEIKEWVQGGLETYQILIKDIVDKKKMYKTIQKTEDISLVKEYTYSPVKFYKEYVFTSLGDERDELSATFLGDLEYYKENSDNSIEILDCLKDLEEFHYITFLEGMKDTPEGVYTEFKNTLVTQGE